MPTSIAVLYPHTFPEFMNHAIMIFKIVVPYFVVGILFLYLGRFINNRERNKYMFDSAAFKADLQAFADKWQVHIKGNVNPVSPDDSAFDVTATPAGASSASPSEPVA